MKLAQHAPTLSGGSQTIESTIRAGFARLQTELRRRVARWTAGRQKARTLRDLYRMSDRELWDVGLSRCDFSAIESGTYRRD